MLKVGQEVTDGLVDELNVSTGYGPIAKPENFDREPAAKTRSGREWHAPGAAQAQGLPDPEDNPARRTEKTPRLGPAPQLRAGSYQIPL